MSLVRLHGRCTWLALLALTALPLSAQQPIPLTYPESFNQPMPLSSQLGTLTRKVTTTSPQAQAYFDQGVRLIWAFTPQEGARSMREAQKHDPNCAMCYWGEAWGWGPYLNGGMNAAGGPRAYAAIQQALKLKDRASPVERALIDAMAVRYEEQHLPARRAVLDTAYSKAMAEVYRRYPKDLEVGSLYAESLMLLNPARAGYRIENPSVQAIHKVLEEVLEVDVHYPGACHLYVHATEGTQRPDKAEECAQYLSNSMPAASHINHMPSHTYNNVGRWGDATAANVMAVKSDRQARLGDGQAFAIYATHNLSMLLYSASFDGQGAVAMQAARDLAVMNAGSSANLAYTLVRFGRFEDALSNPLGVNATGGARAAWDFARGYAHLRLAQTDSAKAYLARLESGAQGGGGGGGRGGGGGGGGGGLVPGIITAILKGEIARSEGRTDEGIAVLQEAATLEDQLPYAEPGQLPFSPRHWLGAALLEAGRPADAERVYKEELVKHPHNGWSLFGLEKALTAQGKTAEAATVKQELAVRWVRSDTWLPSSRY
jgi:tetratricopeptide (TPR) repeat protein